MKNKLIKCLALLLILSFTTGIITACRVDSILPIGQQKNDDEDDDEEEETESRKKTSKETEDDSKDIFDVPETKEKAKKTEADKDDGDADTDTDDGDKEETTTESSGTKATSKAIGKTTVSNAYSKTFKTKYIGKVTSKIPKITIDGVSTSAINKEISNKFKSKAKSHKVTYSYYIGKTYVSIFVTLKYDSDFEESSHYVYNVYRKTGKKLSRTEMLKTLGMKTSSFESRAKKAIKKYWKKNKYISMDKKAYAKAYSEKTLKKAIPYVNSKGKVSYLVNSMELPVGGNYYDVFGTC